MAQTSTAINACDAVLKLDNQSGSLVDISGSSNEIGMDLTNELGVLHTFQTRFPVRLECKSDATITLKAIYSGLNTESVSQLLDWYYNTRGHRTLAIYLPDDQAGSDLFTFEVFLESLNVPAKGDEAAPILVTAVLKPTGTYTLASVAS